MQTPQHIWKRSFSIIPSEIYCMYMFKRPLPRDLPPLVFQICFKFEDRNTEESDSSVLILRCLTPWCTLNYAVFLSVWLCYVWLLRVWHCTISAISIVTHGVWLLSVWLCNGVTAVDFKTLFGNIYARKIRGPEVRLWRKRNSGRRSRYNDLNNDHWLLELNFLQRNFFV